MRETLISRKLADRDHQFKEYHLHVYPPWRRSG